jgi:hypothetical protein
MRSKLTPVAPEIELLEAVVYAKEQPEYEPLPVSRSQDGDIVSRWRPNLRARIALLFGADIYLTQLTFNRGLPPVRVSLEKPKYGCVRKEEHQCSFRPSK